MRTLFRYPVWRVVLFSLIGLFTLPLLQGNINAMEYFLSDMNPENFLSNFRGSCHTL